MLPDHKGEKLMGKVRKHVIYDGTSKGKGNYNVKRVLLRMNPTMRDIKDL